MDNPNQSHHSLCYYQLCSDTQTFLSSLPWKAESFPSAGALEHFTPTQSKQNAGLSKTLFPPSQILFSMSCFRKKKKIQWIFWNFFLSLNNAPQTTSPSPEILCPKSLSDEPVFCITLVTAVVQDLTVSGLHCLKGLLWSTLPQSALPVLPLCTVSLIYSTLKSKSIK